MGASSLLCMIKEKSRYKPVFMFFVIFGAILTLIGLSSIMAKTEQIRTQSVTVTQPGEPNNSGP